MEHATMIAEEDAKQPNREPEYLVRDRPFSVNLRTSPDLIK
jgi:hypothetical protein